MIRNRIFIGLSCLALLTLTACSQQQDQPLAPYVPTPDNSVIKPSTVSSGNRPDTSASTASVSKDVTAKVEYVGNPFSDKPAYARNVWDMQLFDNKIYIGHGNSSNSEPAPNAGPIPIVYYDLDTRKFVKPKVTTYNNAKQSKKIMKQAADEEQIDLYKVLNGSIYIPGHDASGENWDFGNFYKLEKDGWKKYRNIPNAIHVYDMAYYQGKLFAAISSDGAEVLRSDDGGKSWKSIGYTSEGARAYTFFTLQNKLYAAGMFYLDNKNTRQTSLLTVNERLEVTSTKVDTAAWLPGGQNKRPCGLS
ncbi:hypothetical protein ACFSL6_01455 [Paenibacillus thailandensis]|uniref:hypothetical protein n=1 Tax=Paenibacillus thailandensis TaxID=393250 RepID=UPI003631DD9F